MEKIQKQIIFFVAGFLLFVASPAQAATLYFSPSSGSYGVGKTFSVSVYVASAEQAMNAASGAISFPVDKLEAISLSKTGSVINLWVQEPSFSQFSGTVNFEGIVLNPGFTGSAGKLIDVIFRPKSAGNANLSFSSGAILANDGKGTNILTGFGNAAFILTEITPFAPETVAPSQAGAPSAPKISSPTHPESEEWYNNNRPKFVWDLPEGITATRLLYDKNSDSRPAVLYESPISEKELDEVKDGVYYFHAQFKNKNGWGKISHFKFQIDTIPPELGAIKFIDGQETDNPRPTLSFEARDGLSGIDHYSIKIGEGDFFELKPEISASILFSLPYQAPGKRTILVQAFDKAGNYTAVSEEFIIASKELKKGEKIWNIWSWILSFFVMVIPLLGLIILFLFIFWWGRHRLSILKKKINKETREAEEALHKAVMLLKEDIGKQIKMLETTKRFRKLTEEEEKIIEHFRKDLDDAEKYIKKEIKDIEKEIE